MTKADLREAADARSKVLGHIERGSKVLLEETKGEWGRVMIPMEASVELNNSEWTGKGYWIRLSVLSKEYVAKVSVDEKRRERYCREHQGIREEFRRAIKYGGVEIGMTEEMVIASLGYPSDINRTVTRYGVEQQWVYRDGGREKYVYFEKGVVTAYQD